MRERGWQRRLGPPLLALLLLLTCLSPGTALAAFQASVYSNKTAFDRCDGTPSDIPDRIRIAARDGFAFLGYAATSFTGTGFDKANVLARTPADAGIYVHSHGDWYGAYDHAGFRDDDGDCAQAVVYSTEIRARKDAAGAVAGQLVIMSTCHLAEAPPKAGALSMNLAYDIERQKGMPDGSNFRGPEFYLGYVGVAWTNEMLAFEQNFWKYMRAGYSVGGAFDRSRRDTALPNGTRPDWFGQYTWMGRPGPWPSCPDCL
ncbi:MAG TPA: hypothetical protein VFK38_06305 [Candidatus Limnocylindrales bacterium]|nr:hypothetical protein [Candidatus Limnocylindrales bacterium]